MQNRLSAAQNQQNRNLALAVQRTAAKHRRFQPQQVPQGASEVDVAGCGNVMGYNQGYWPAMGGPQSPWTGPGPWHNIPNMAPELPPGSNFGVVEAHLLRAGVYVQANVTGPRVISFALTGGSAYYIGGFASGNDFNELLIHNIEHGGVPLNVVREVDAGFFNVEQCWCEIEIGCVTTVAPLTIGFSQIGTGSNPPFLNLMFVGTFQASWNGCGYPFPGWTPGWPGGGGGFGGGGFGGPGGFAPGPGFPGTGAPVG